MKSSRFSLEIMVQGLLLLLAFFLFRRPDVISGWRMGLVLALVLSVIPYLSGRCLPWRERDRIVRWLVLGWSGFAIIVLLTALAGETLAVAPADLARGFLLPAVLPLVILTWVRDERVMRWLFIAFIAGLLIVMGRNVGQYVAEWGAVGHFDSNILLHRPYGDGLVFGLPFLLGSAIQSQSRLMRIGSLLLVVVDLLMIAMTGARGAWLAAGIVVLVYLIAYRNRALIAVVFAAIAAVAIGMVTFIPPELGLNRIQQGLDTSSRTSGTWGPALEMIAERPLSGYGYGSEVFHKEFNRRAPASPHWSIRQSQGPHNLFLDIGFSAGILGLALFIGVLATAAFGILRHLSRLGKKPDRCSFRYMAGITLLALMLGSVVIQGMVEGRSWPPIAFWLGLSLAWLGLAGSEVPIAKDSE